MVYAYSKYPKKVQTFCKYAQRNQSLIFNELACLCFLKIKVLPDKAEVLKRMRLQSFHLPFYTMLQCFNL